MPTQTSYEGRRLGKDNPFYCWGDVGIAPYDSYFQIFMTN